MPVYKAPLRDTRFLLNEVFDFPEHYRNLVNGAEATPDMVDAILGECAKLCEEVIAPLYHSGDEEGCHLENGEVRTPKGYKEAYEAYVAGGWQGLSHPVEYGGQGLPMSLGALWGGGHIGACQKRVGMAGGLGGLRVARFRYAAQFWKKPLWNDHFIKNYVRCLT